MKVHLDEPIIIEGVKIGHTYEGLKHLIEHYSNCKARASPMQMDDKARAHCQSLITDYQLHIILYDKYPQNEITKIDSKTVDHLPGTIND